MSQAAPRACAKCGSAEFYASGACKACAKARTAAWVEKNKGRAAEYQRVYAAENRDRLKQYAADYHVKNAEKKKAAAKKWLAENRARANARKAAYRAAHPESHRISKHNREARVAANGGTLSRGISKKLYRLQRGKCPCCGNDLGNDYHIDHIIPIALGGMNSDDNVQLLRAECNLKKNAQHPVDYMQSKGFLL